MVILEKLRLGAQSQAISSNFNGILSHNDLYTGMLLHETDPEIAEACHFCNLKEETLSHICLKRTVVVKFWERIRENFTAGWSLSAFLQSWRNAQGNLTGYYHSEKHHMGSSWYSPENTISTFLSSLKLNFKYKFQGQLIPCIPDINLEGILTPSKLPFSSRLDC